MEKKNEESNGCCSLNYKTGVQIMAGILTIFSAVFLVLHYVKLDQMIEDKFERMFKQQPTWNLQVSDRNQFHEIFFNDLTKFLFSFFQIIVSTIILAAIAVNLLVFFGSTGERWRRVFLMPWLIYYGVGILIAIGK